jgi:acyl dehydratase
MSLTVGQKAERSLTLTTDHVRLYSQITGDYNPLHVDAEFAAATRFKKLIVQGGLTSGLLNAIVAMDLPGPGTVFLETRWRFTNPVFIGDTITAVVEILEVHATKPVSRIGARIVRSDGETVLEGDAWCYTASPAVAATGT